MQRRTVIASIGAILGTSVGAAAYTSATVSRDATFTVASEGDAYIGLQAGTVDGITDGSGSSDPADVLNISIDQLNRNGEFVFGDSADLTTYAFSITNNDSAERTITISYDKPGVEFALFEATTQGDWSTATLINQDSTNPEDPTLATVTSSNSIDWTAANTAISRVVMTVDTSQVESGTAGKLTFTV